MSKIEVNAIEPQCGTTLTVGAAGTTVTVPSNVVKSNALQASDAGNIISQSGTTITLGATGDSINLASGATQSGFGRTGTVDWQTGDIKTATFTAANGEGYFANTSGGAFTMNLPAGSTGAIVSVQDYNNTFDTHALTVDANGSEKINGGDGGEPITLNTEGRGVTFVYIDATVGWRSVQDNDFTKAGTTPVFITATGGTITTVCTDYKVHTFTGPGTFTVCTAASCAANNAVAYMVVAGGAGGGYEDAGGGGAGGFREGTTAPIVPYTASPLVAATGITVSAQGYPIVIGGAGAGGTVPAATPNGFGDAGSVSSGLGISSAGGGGGGGGECNGNNGIRQGQPGGSGGGGAGVFGAQPQDGPDGPSGGNGNTPSVSPSQGFPGGNGPTVDRNGNSVAELGGGGGGATQVGQRTPSPSSDAAGGAGGAGATTSINGSPTAFAGGGAGGVHPSSGTGSAGAGGAGGGGNGGYPGCLSGTAGGTNTGGGGGGGGGNGGTPGSSGGSGIVIIRYKFQ